MSQVIPALQQIVTTLSALVTQLGGQVAGAQGQAGAAGVQGGGGSAVASETGAAPAGTAPAGTAPADASVTGGGAPGKGDPGQSPAASGCGCSHAAGAAKGVGQTPEQATEGAKDKKAGAKKEEKLPEAPPLNAAGDGKLNSDALTVKGAKMTAEQRKLTEIVLRKGKEMGANQKVLETAVATMIQESTIRNDKSVDSKDHDSLGLFQQRPSAGWGTREQISDPEYAAKKFFEKAIPNDKKNPDQPKTRLAQSVQISAFPDAYAQWDKEAEKIVADYMS